MIEVLNKQLNNCFHWDDYKNISEVVYSPIVMFPFCVRPFPSSSSDHACIPTSLVSLSHHFCSLFCFKCPFVFPRLYGRHESGYGLLHTASWMSHRYRDWQLLTKRKKIWCWIVLHLGCWFSIGSLTFCQTPFSLLKWIKKTKQKNWRGQIKANEEKVKRLDWETECVRADSRLKDNILWIPFCWEHPPAHHQDDPPQPALLFSHSLTPWGRK